MLNVASTLLDWYVLHCISLVAECGWSVLKTNLNLQDIMIFTYRNFTNCNLILLVSVNMIIFIDRYQNILRSTSHPSNGLHWPEGHLYFLQKYQKRQNSVWMVTAIVTISVTIFSRTCKTTIVFLLQSRLNLLFILLMYKYFFVFFFWRTNVLKVHYVYFSKIDQLYWVNVLSIRFQWGRKNNKNIFSI